MMIKKVLLAAALILAAYGYGRIFMIAVTWAPWQEPRTFLQKDERGYFEITFFPDRRFLTRSNSENGSCARAGIARGSRGRRVIGRLHYVDCPFLIKFHFPPAGIEMACIELETTKEEGRGCTPPNAVARMAQSSLFYRLMGFSENGGLYDTGEFYQRVSDPDVKSLYAIADKLAPLSEDESGSKRNAGATRPR